jgi:pantetheine-phosphate adenylyltransferase
MKRVAVFPGSFDPITKGHEEIVRRASSMFDEIIVAIGNNTSKAAMFSAEQRAKWVESAFVDLANVRIESYEGLTVDFCKNHQATFILRGVRSVVDFEYERAIAVMNKSLLNEIETVVLFSDPQWSSISSTIIREIIKNKGDVSQFLPAGVNVYE